DHDASHRGALSGGGSAASASAAGLAWMPTAAGFNQAEPEAEPEPKPDPVAAAEDEAAADARAAARAAAARPAPTPTAEAAEPAAEAAPAGASPEWETQWSETPPAEPHAELHQKPGSGSHGDHTAASAVGGSAAAANVPVHHPEYTEPHAPTLPGAESAAAETEPVPGLDATAEAGRTAEPATPTAQAPAPEQAAAPAPAPAQAAAPAAAGASLAEAETRQTAMSSAASETAVGHTAEPSGHLAVDQPYGEGSAAPAPDGSGPEGFTVKGNASSMVYHEETSPAFEETRAEVWFLSAAHAEAAGFRPPRRTRQ
ncbi:MAG: hypothetical protein U1D68_11140, partial [Arthrobacter sp.]|nr:hypothetical protein [Arthrobacter sp.]